MYVQVVQCKYSCDEPKNALRESVTYDFKHSTLGNQLRFLNPR